RSAAQIVEGSPGLAGAGGGGAGPVAVKRRRTTCAGMQPSRRGEAHARRVVAAPPPPAPARPGRLRESLEPRLHLANEHLHAFDGLVMVEEPSLTDDQWMAEAAGVRVHLHDLPVDRIRVT